MSLDLDERWGYVAMLADRLEAENGELERLRELLGRRR